MAGRYRSWVVRSWSRDEQCAVRLTIEEVRSGRLVELWGERAAEIEEVISAASVPAAIGEGGPGSEPPESLPKAEAIATRPPSG
jgi:hypothetical protein